MALAARPPWSSPMQSMSRPPRHFLSVRVRKRLSACFLAPRVLRVIFEDASRRARLVWSRGGHSPTKSENTCSAAGGLPSPPDRGRDLPTEAGFARPKPSCVGLPTGGCCVPGRSLGAAATRHASFLSWGSQRSSLHRQAFQVSTPTRRTRRASVEGCQLLDMFRPCRFSRLRRLSPPGGCGLVASRCRSWDSPRFRLCSGACRGLGPRYVPCERRALPSRTRACGRHRSVASPRPAPSHRGLRLAPPTRFRGDWAAHDLWSPLPPHTPDPGRGDLHRPKPVSPSTDPGRWRVLLWCGPPVSSASPLPKQPDPFSPGDL